MSECSTVFCRRVSGTHFRDAPGSSLTRFHRSCSPFGYVPELFGVGCLRTAKLSKDFQNRSPDQTLRLVSLAVRLTNWKPLPNGLMYRPHPQSPATPCSKFDVVGSKVWRLAWVSGGEVHNMNHAPFLIGVFPPPEESSRHGQSRTRRESQPIIGFLFGGLDRRRPSSAADLSWIRCCHWLSFHSVAPHRRSVEKALEPFPPSPEF